jgi:putative multiple sugar transport system permease protein
MLPVIITGRIDLSVGSVAGFVGAVVSVMIIRNGTPVSVALIIGILTGAAIGAWQGFWTAYMGVPAFITTLSSMMAFRGLTIVVLDGKSIGPFPNFFRSISTAYVPDFFNVDGINMVALLSGIIITLVIIWREIAKRNDSIKYQFETLPIWLLAVKLILITGAINFITYSLSIYNGIPVQLVILFVIIIFYTFITTQTVIGRRIYAIGGNEQAAKLSGINTKRLIFITNVNMGILAAVAGILFTARLNAGTPRAGAGFELDAIAACFIGGASVYGGTGKVSGAIIGMFIMGVMNNGMSIIGVPIDLQQAIKAMVILFAVAFDIISKSKSS